MADRVMKGPAQGKALVGTGGLCWVFSFPLLIVECSPHNCQHLVTAGRKISLGACIELEEKDNTDTFQDDSEERRGE